MEYIMGLYGTSFNSIKTDKKGAMSLYSHKPKAYECPFCRVVSGKEKPNKGTKQRDIIYQDKHVTAFIASKW